MSWEEVLIAYGFQKDPVAWNGEGFLLDDYVYVQTQRVNAGERIVSIRSFGIEKYCSEAPVSVDDIPEYVFERLHKDNK